MGKYIYALVSPDNYGYTVNNRSIIIYKLEGATRWTTFLTDVSTDIAERIVDAMNAVEEAK